MDIAVERNGTNEYAQVTWTLEPSGEFADKVTETDVVPFNGVITFAAGERIDIVG